MSLDLHYYFEHLDQFPFPDFFDGLEKPSDILEKAKTYLNKLLVEPDVHEFRGEMKGEAVHFYGNYFIDEGTVIYDDVTIMGPVYIGKGVEIMPGAIIRPYSILSDRCSIGHGSEAKHCVMFAGSKIASLAFAGDSVLGKSARIGSGVITANRKFNQSNATVKMDGQRHDLGTDYFGCILGDASRLGANSVTQPGTHIGPHSWVYPLTNVRGFIPKETRVYQKVDLAFEENEVVELKP